MLLEMSCVLFTYVTKAELDRPNGWLNCRIYFRDECHQHIRRQQQSGGDMLLAGITRERVSE